MTKKESQEGLTVKKEDDFSEWFTQLLTKSELIEYTDVSGCYVFRPRSYAIWENVQKYLDSKFKKLCVKNAYFPLLIPESSLKKESKHVEGFTPEVAWVTHSGETKLNERLAVRPTSETIMYPAYANWIRSWKDLPLKINQWCNVVRWEFKNPVPFLRSREFLWQEGHTVFAAKQDAVKEALQMLDVYAEAYKEIYAVPMIKGRKTEKEKFPGADTTNTIETFLPSGKAIQGATSHNLGQNFSKVFDIKFKDKDGKEKLVWQNSWGFTTRSIGIMIMMHSDNKGLVLPPRVAENKVVIVPILFDKTKEKVLKISKQIIKDLSALNPLLDDREEYSPGWKFNEWEMKGIPVRIEIGPKDIEKNQVVVVRRDTGNKESIKISDLKKKIPKILENIQDSLYEKAEKYLESSIVKSKTMADLIKAIKNKKLVFSQWCGSEECEDWIKDKTGGAKILCIPFDQPKKLDKCVYCGKPAKYAVYIAKSY